MTVRLPRPGAGSAAGARTPVAAGLVMGLVMGLVAGCGDGGGVSAARPAAQPDDAAAAPRKTSPSAPTIEVDADSAAAAPSETRDARPTAIVLPSGTTVPVQVATTGAGGLLRVPDDIRAAGWWDGGARVGAAYGAVVVAGHVDSVRQGLGPFAELLGVRRGDRVVVRAAGLRQSFAVSAVDLVPKVTLDTRDRTFAGSGPLRLVLITCAGEYDPGRGGYQDLAVVTARPSSAAVPVGGR